MKYTASIITYSALDHARRCIDSVLNSRNSDQLKLVLTANGNEQAFDYFTSIARPQDVTLRYQNNLGFIEPSRRAFEFCDTQYFLLVNDDVTVSPDWLERLEKPFINNPTCALSSPNGGHFGTSRNPDKKAVEYLWGHCMMGRSDLIREVGLFSDYLKQCYWEEVDLALRLIERGYTLHVVPDCKVKHIGAATSRHIKGINEIKQRNFLEVKKRFPIYFGAKPTTPTIQWIDEDVVARLGGWREKTWRLAEKLATENKLTQFVETGCWHGIEACGCSTVILATFAARTKGMLDSYDINQEHIAVARKAVADANLSRYVRFHCGDSIEKLAGRDSIADFVYLDSFDMGDGPDFSPCQKHQLGELEAVLPILGHNAVVVLDDNLGEKGKTFMSLKRLERLPFEKLMDDYQLVYHCTNSRRLTPHKFCVLSGHLSNYAPLAAQTCYRNKAQYCFRHGYDLKVIRHIPKEFFEPGSHANGFSWGRLAYMLRLVESGAYEWVWVVGCDTLVTNMDVMLESLVDVKPLKEWPKMLPRPTFAPHGVLHSWSAPDYKPDGRAHVVICGDRGSHVQADSFLVRSSPQGAAYLRDILNQRRHYKRHIWVENQAMIDLARKHLAITGLLPQHRMNSFEYRLFHHMGPWYKDGLDMYGNRGDWKPGDFLVHWPAITLDKRLQLVREKQKEVVY